MNNELRHDFELEDFSLPRLKFKPFKEKRKCKRGNTMKARQNELKAKHQHVSSSGFNNQLIFCE